GSACPRRSRTCSACRTARRTIRSGFRSSAPWVDLETRRLRTGFGRDDTGGLQDAPWPQVPLPPHRGTDVLQRGRPSEVPVREGPSGRLTAHASHVARGALLRAARGTPQRAVVPNQAPTDPDPAPYRAGDGVGAG